MTASASATASSDLNTSSATSTASKTAITVIFVIAGSAAAVFVAWTVFRKWKLKKSSTFEDRMNPIDWQQPTEETDHSIPGSLRRTASAAPHGSFTSSSAHDDAYNGTSTLQPIPDHDFTAGSTNLAPVGGYADLARGTSPSPPMSELNRGPSMNGANYGGYGVPLHHNGGYDYSSGARY